MSKDTILVSKCKGCVGNYLQMVANWCPHVELKNMTTKKQKVFKKSQITELDLAKLILIDVPWR